MTSSPRSEPLGLAGQRLFITGGTGFIGRSLLDYLAESAARHGAAFRATVLSRDPADFLRRFPEYAGHQAWLEFVAGSLDQLPRLPHGCTAVVHAAADTHCDGGDALAWLDQLVQGTRRVLDFARGAGVQRLLLLSSGAVYGRQPAHVPALAEDCALAPPPADVAAVYAHGKRMAEHLGALYTAQRGLPCVAARCFAVLSRHVPLDGPYAAGNFIRDALSPACDRIAVQGDGSAVRTYLDGRDMAHWMFTLLLGGTPGAAYNVGSDQAVTVLELARRIGAQLAPDKPVVVQGRAMGAARSVYVPDIARARALGLAVETTLEEAIAAAAAAAPCRPPQFTSARGAIN